MKKFSLMTGVVALGMLLSALPARAQQAAFGSQGDFAFGIERAFGFYVTKRTLDNPLQEVTHDSNTFTFATAPHAPPNPYALPRVGVDYFIIDHLSLGGSIAYSSVCLDEEDFDKVDNQVDPASLDQKLFLFSPRVGYAIMFGNVVGIWPRGGVTYYAASDDFGPVEVDENAFALTAEFQLILSPIPHLGFTIGPVVDFSITGERENLDPQEPDYDLKHRSFGLITAGIFGWI